MCIYLIFWKLQVWFAAYSLISRGWMDGHPWVATCQTLPAHVDHLLWTCKGFGQGSFASAYTSSKIWVLGSFHLELHGSLRNLAVLNALEQHHQKSLIPDTVHALETPTESTGGLKQITSYRDSFEIARQALFGESCEDGRPSSAGFGHV